MIDEPPTREGADRTFTVGETMIVMGVGVMAALITGFWVASTPALYESEVTIVARASRMGDDPAQGVQAAMFTPLVTSAVLVEQVIANLELSTPPLDYDAARFGRDALRVSALGGVPLLSVRVRMTDPDLAARAANELARLAVDRSRELSRQEGGSARDRLNDLYIAARQRYEAAQAALEAFRTSSNIDLVRRDAQAVLDERGTSLKLSLDLASEKARLARIDEEVKTRPRIDSLKRSIDSDPALLAAGQALAGSSALGLTLTDEEVNKVYEAIDEQRASSRAMVAALDARLAAQRRSGVAGSKSAMLAKLYAAERQLSDLELDVAIARKAYELAASQYESARLQVATRSAELGVLASASPPSEPLGRGILLKSALALALAASAAFVAVYGRRRLAS